MPSALEVHLYTTMRYINRRFTYLLTYLPTKQILVSIGTVEASSQSKNRRNITTLWLFLLSCPVLFSRCCGQVEPKDRFSGFMAQTTRFRTRRFHLEVRMMGDVIWAKYATNPLKLYVNSHFKPKRRNIKILIFPRV